MASVAQVYALADAVGERFRALILLAAVSGLRWSELVGPRRCDLDLERQHVRVPRRIAELRDGSMEAGPTKTAAGVRTVAIPAVVIPELHRHLADHVDDGDQALIFTGRQGGSLRRGNYRRAVRWEASLAAPACPRASTSTTCDSPATTSPPRPAPAPVS